MAAFYDHLKQQAKPYETIVKTLLNNDLKAICKEEGLQVSGVKAVLQQRIIQRLDDAVQSCDAPRFHDICRRIGRYGKVNSNQSVPSNDASSPPRSQRPASISNSNNADSAPHQHVNPNNTTKFPSLQYNGQLGRTFTESPFYTIKEQLTNSIPLPTMNSARHTSSATIRLSYNQASGLASDRSLRLMVYCYVEYESSPHDIAFPNSVDIKVNGDQFSGNLRGIKKKPGTTKPADITRMMKLQPGFSNTVAVTYAGTDKKYCFIVCIVKKTTVDELVERIKRGRFISKQQVIQEMVNKSKDPDIVTTSSVMSLKCPLSATRMDLPCRSIICTHNQCFDATSFLQLQEQAPQWSCPICNKIINFPALATDQYVRDILSSVPTSVEQVTIEPSGKWRLGSQTDEDFRVPSSKAKRTTSDAWDVDSASPVEPSDPRVDAIRAESISTPQSFARTPTLSSREPSRSASTAPPRSGSKRPAEEVIDLTISDEDDPPPRRPPKRQSTGTYSFGSTAPNPINGSLPNRQSMPNPHVYTQYSPISQDQPHFSMTMPHKPIPNHQQFSPTDNEWYGAFGS